MKTQRTTRTPTGFTENFMYNTSWTWTNTLTYSKTIGDHTIKILGGTEAIRNYMRGFFGTRNNYPITNAGNLTVDPALWTLLFGPPGGQVTGNLNSNSGIAIDLNNPPTPVQSALYSQFGRVDYNYADKYLLSGTLRRDGSSVFDEHQRYGVFHPLLQVGVFHAKPSFGTVGWLNDLKLRGGWGKLGAISNINPTNAFDLYSQIAANSYYDITGSNNASVLGIYASQNGNKATTWEEDIITNIGFDAAVFDNKLSFSFEWYKKDISGLLFRPAAPATGGGATPAFVNGGNIQNTGVDMAVTYHGNVDEFRFDVTGTFTSYKNKVKSLPAGRKYYDQVSAGSNRFGAFSRLQPGQALGAFYGFQVLGLYQSDDDVNKSPKQGSCRTRPVQVC